jgi:hypothetical protein
MQPWYKRLLHWFGDTPVTNAHAERVSLSARELVEMALNTRADEIGCAECFDELDRFVEVHLAGKNAAEAMPLVEDHLRRCPPCREEYETLLLALRASGAEADE